MRYSSRTDDYSVVFGIFKFFSFMDSKAIKTYLFEAVLHFASLVDQGKVEVERNTGKTTPGSLFSASVMMEPFLVGLTHLDVRREDPEPALPGRQGTGA